MDSRHGKRCSKWAHGGRAVMMVSLAWAAGCGSSSSSNRGTAPQLRPTSTPITYLVVGQNDRVSAAMLTKVRSQLLKLRHRVTSDSKSDYDAAVVIRSRLEEDPGLIAVYVNGKRKVDYIAHVAIDALIDKQFVVSQEMSFDAEDGPDNDELRGVVAELAAGHVVSGAITARARREEAAEQERQRVEAERLRIEQEMAQQQDEQAWESTNPNGCRTPTTANGCDRVLMYVNRFPDGSHAAEATEMLQEAQTLLEALRKDARAWADADAGACRMGRSQDSCVGVELYLIKFPDGPHVAEAEGLLEGL